MGFAVGAAVGLAVAVGFGVAVADGLEVGLAVGVAVGFAVGAVVGFTVAVAEGFAVALLPEEGLLAVLLPELGFVVADGFAVALGFDAVLPEEFEDDGLLAVLFSVLDEADELASLRTLGFAAFRFCTRCRRGFCTRGARACSRFAARRRCTASLLFFGHRTAYCTGCLCRAVF